MLVYTYRTYHRESNKELYHTDHANKHFSSVTSPQEARKLVHNGRHYTFHAYKLHNIYVHVSYSVRDSTYTLYSEYMYIVQKTTALMAISKLYS